MKQIRLKIEGMHCAGCVARVENTLKAAGCTDINVVLETGEASFSVNDDLGAAQFCAAINKLGFKAEEK